MRSGYEVVMSNSHPGLCTISMRSVEAVRKRFYDLVTHHDSYTEIGI